MGKGNKEGKSQFLFSKVKLAKKIPTEESIPKLELDGLNLSAVLIGIVKNAFPHVEFAARVLWCDSKTTLQWSKTRIYVLQAKKGQNFKF